VTATLPPIKWHQLKWATDGLADGTIRAWAWTYDPAWTRQTHQVMADVVGPTEEAALEALYRALASQIESLRPGQPIQGDYGVLAPQS
jgi:hypothetical protein